MVEQPADIATAPVVTDEPMSFAAGGEGLTGLGSGWAEAEAWGIWSIGSEALMRLHVPGVVARPVQLGLSYRTIPRPDGSPLEVELAVGSSVTRRLLPPEQHRGELVLDVPAGIVALTIRNIDPRSPLELGLSKDIRALGLGVESIRTLPPPDLTAEAQVERLLEQNAALRARAEALARRERWPSLAPSYEGDFLATWQKSVGFLEDPRFRRAYARGAGSGPSFGDDLHIEWRVEVCCWAAALAARLPGDFVECGVNTGIFALAVCEYVDFNSLAKTFWLFDTFNGIPGEQISENEHALGRPEMNELYFDCFELAQRNFSVFPRAVLVRGVVPESLAEPPIDRVAYLSLDMNIAYPERAALEFFWPKLVPGAPVVLDDYGWTIHREQKDTLDEFAAAQGVEILELPTGQGLLLKS